MVVLIESTDGRLESGGVCRFVRSIDDWLCKLTVVASPGARLLRGLVLLRDCWPCKLPFIVSPSPKLVRGTRGPLRSAFLPVLRWEAGPSKPDGAMLFRGLRVLTTVRALPCSIQQHHWSLP